MPNSHVVVGGGTGPVEIPTTTPLGGANKRTVDGSMAQPIEAKPFDFLLIQTHKGDVTIQLPALGADEAVQILQDASTDFTTNNITILPPQGSEIAQPTPNNAVFGASLVIGPGAQYAATGFTFISGANNGGILIF